MTLMSLPVWAHLCLLLGCLISLVAMTIRFQRRESSNRSSASSNVPSCAELQAIILEQKLTIVRLETQLQAHNDCLKKYQALEEELKKEQQFSQTLRLSEQQARLNAESKQQQLEEKIEWLTQSEGRLKILFENIANLCLEQTTQKNSDHHQKTLSEFLTPLKQQLETFQFHIQEKFNHESKERHLLAHELSKIQQLNLQLSQDATHLTQALLGNKKIQGTWGEVLLEHALEASGLRKDREYKLQVSLVHPQTEQKIQPDAIVYLPQGKSIIIDSKISLTAYTKYINAPSPEKSDHLTAHITALKNHIKNLGKKSYYHAKGLESLDFVLLFVPLEPAFNVALEFAPELLQEAQSHHIMLVSPTTLLVALKTIQNLWQFERQSNHAAVIAAKASQLYDKCRLFLESFQGLGVALDRAQTEYHLGLSRLSQGKGNILRQLESFKDLGVVIQKPLPTINIEDLPILNHPEVEDITENAN